MKIETKGADKVRHCETTTGEYFTMLPPKECTNIDKDTQKPSDYISSCKEQDREAIEKELKWEHVEYTKIREEVSEPRVTKEQIDGESYKTADIDHTIVYENAYTNDHFPVTQTHTLYEAEFYKEQKIGECTTEVKEHHVYSPEVIDTVNRIEEILKSPQHDLTK